MTFTGTTYSIADLAHLAETSTRQIHAWKDAGLLPSALSPGRYARYSDEHLLRTRVIVALRRRDQPLREIRRLMKGKTAEELQSLLDSLNSQLGSAASLPALSANESAVPNSSGIAATQAPPPVWEVHNVRRGLVVMVCVEEGAEVRRLAQQMCENYRGIAAELGSTQQH